MAGLGGAFLGVRLLVAFAAPPLTFAVFAHEAHPPAQQAATPDESAFLAENEAAMNKMMSAMEAKPTGDIDRDFVAMMVPHHQGGIDMAVRRAANAGFSTLQLFTTIPQYYGDKNNIKPERVERFRVACQSRARARPHSRLSPS